MVTKNFNQTYFFNNPQEVYQLQASITTQTYAKRHPPKILLANTTQQYLKLDDDVTVGNPVAKARVIL